VQKFRLFALNIPDKGLHTDQFILFYQYNKKSHDEFFTKNETTSSSQLPIKTSQYPTNRFF